MTDGQPSRQQYGGPPNPRDPDDRRWNPVVPDWETHEMREGGDLLIYEEPDDQIHTKSWIASDTFRACYE